MFGSANRSASYVAAVVDVVVVFFFFPGNPWSVCRPVPPNPDPIQDQIIVIFHTSFQAWVSKIHTRFRPGVGRTYVIIS